jgi:large subunit ribosomal protein L9
MKIILLKDIAKVGKKFDQKTVSDGYALNYLIPNHLAEIATKEAVRRSEVEKSRAAAERAIQEELLLKNIEDLDGLKIEIGRKANEKGHLFANIHETELADELKKQTRLDVSPEFIVIPGKHLKEVGEHQIEAKTKDKTVKFTVSVKPL